MTDDKAEGRVLRRIRIAHSLIWLFFASAIVAIPVAAIAGLLAMAWGLSLVVWIEVVILAGDRRCPLTGMAERHTDNRAANFDIFLPVWLARYNQLIFGSLFAIDECLLVAQWAHRHFGAAGG